jgi:hypothetical protein
MEKALVNTKFPPVIPAHANRMYAADLGNIWLQEYRIGSGEPYRWSVFDPNGQWLGIVQTPAQLTVNEIGKDYIIGVWRDDLDVQHVRIYSLVKPRG